MVYIDIDVDIDICSVATHEMHLFSSMVCIFNELIFKGQKSFTIG